MPLPAPLLRTDPRSSKKDFGHLLIIAGSPSMLGAAALSSLAAMRSGAGLVTAAVPSGSNLTLQKKISNCVMTKPLAQGRGGAFSLKAFGQLKKIWDQYDAMAIGPGLGRDPGTLQFARQVIIHGPKPLVVDADALFALAGHMGILHKARAPRVLTPHSGEMSRLTGRSIKEIEADRSKMAGDLARRYNCVLLLKGHRTVVASEQGKIYTNRTGNAGMATAGSGDVLTGVTAALLGQGIAPFKAACLGAYLHGIAGDQAEKIKFKTGMIASDIIESLPHVFRSHKREIGRLSRD
jgi:hydroxyethylthiazole kinase-like uncharacterized protein yjeF